MHVKTNNWTKKYEVVFFTLCLFFSEKNVDFYVVFKEPYSFMNTIFLYKVVNMSVFK